jgi:hypothetical protein
MTDWLGEVTAARAADTQVESQIGSADPPEIGAIAEVVAHARVLRADPPFSRRQRSRWAIANIPHLVRLGYPPVIIQKRERSHYLRALDRADRGDVGPLGELFARAIRAT